MGDRANQKARTRAALLAAATELVREGRPASIPDAAERALVSVATAYRYFPSADELWFEASVAAVDFAPTLSENDELIRAAGDDPLGRLEASIRTIGFKMVDDQVPFRRLAKAALDRWFAQADSPSAERMPIRESRRKQSIALIIEPLRGQLSDDQVERLANALGVIMGTDAMLALTDGMGLEADEAKEALLDSGRWLLSGALAELEPANVGSRRDR